jgi:hypothetical protein
MFRPPCREATVCTASRGLPVRVKARTTLHRFLAYDMSNDERLSARHRNGILSTTIVSHGLWFRERFRQGDVPASWRHDLTFVGGATRRKRLCAERLGSQNMATLLHTSPATLSYTNCERNPFHYPSTYCEHLRLRSWSRYICVYIFRQRRTP